MERCGDGSLRDKGRRAAQQRRTAPQPFRPDSAERCRLPTLRNRSLVDSQLVAPRRIRFVFGEPHTMRRGADQEIKDSWASVSSDRRSSPDGSHSISAKVVKAVTIWCAGRLITKPVMQHAMRSGSHFFREEMRCNIESEQLRPEMPQSGPTYYTRRSSGTSTDTSAPPPHQGPRQPLFLENGPADASAQR